MWWWVLINQRWIEREKTWEWKQTLKWCSHQPRNSGYYKVQMIRTRLLSYTLQKQCSSTNTVIFLRRRTHFGFPIPTTVKIINLYCFKPQTVWLKTINILGWFKFVVFCYSSNWPCNRNVHVFKNYWLEISFPIPFLISGHWHTQRWRAKEAWAWAPSFPGQPCLPIFCHQNLILKCHSGNTV